MLSTSNISDVNYYLNTKYFSLAKEQLLDDKQFAGSLIHDLLIDQKFNKEDFTNLCKGKITTVYGEYIELGRKNKDGEIEHDMGRDLTFSAPKSVSLQHNMEGGDKRIKNALFTATKETLYYIERNYTFTRIKDESGKIKLIKTGNFSASLLYENLNRNLEFDDHIHCTIFNATKRPDGNIRSLEFKKIIENKMHFGMIFRMNLANQIQKLGYEIEITDKKYNFFEIKGSDKEICKEFSTRTDEINQKALELNKNPSAKTKELANLLTRNNKELSVDNIKQVIKDRLDKLYSKYNLSKEDIIDHIKSLIFKSKNPKDSSNSSNADIKTENVKTSIAKAIEHLGARKSYFSKEEIINHSSIISFSNRKIFSISDIEKTIDKLINKKFLIKTDISNANHQICYGTRQSLEQEKSIISICYEGKNKFNSISGVKDIEHYFKLQEEEKNIKLTKGQLEAVKLILNCKDQFSIIQGYAGVGKTFAIGKAQEYLDHINQVAKESNPDHINYQIIGLASSGSAAKELESVLGKADTLQYLLRKYNGYANGRGTIDGIEKEKSKFTNKIMLIDESSMISCDQMHGLLNIAKKLDLKLVFLGDKSQILSVDAGLPFHSLQKEDLKIAKMTDIVRQNNPISKAIAYSSYAKDFQSVFEKVGSNLLDCSNHPKLLDLDYDEKNDRYFVTNDHTAKSAAILYHDLDKKEQKNTLLITPSNSTRHLINQYVRQGLDNNKSNPINQTILTNENLTIAQKSNYYFYEQDNILLFNKANKRLNINKNEYFKISKVNDNNQTLLLESLNNSSKLVIFNPNKANSLLDNIEIYKKEIRQYSLNEKIIFTRKIEEANQYKNKETTKEQIPKIINSTIATITNVDYQNKKIDIKLDDNNQIINIDLNNNDHNHILKHSDYGYCLTNYKSQGKTQNNVIIVLESYFKHLADARNTLVAVTRAKDNIHIVTDNKEELIKQIADNYDNKKSDETSIINARYNNNSLLQEKITLEENLFKELNLSNESYNKYQLSLKNNQNFNKYHNQEFDKQRIKELQSENIDPELTKSDNFTGRSIDKIIEPHKKIFIESEEQKQAKIKELTKQKKLRQKASLTDVEDKYNHKSENKPSPKSSYYEKRQQILDNLSDHEIKNHFTNFIHDKFNNSDLTRLDEAIDKAFSNQGRYQRFGRNLSSSIIWHGKAGSIKDFRTDQSEKWGIGNIKIEDYQLNQVKDQLEQKSQYKSKEQHKEEYLKRREEQKLKQIIEYNQKAKEAEKLFNYHKNNKINQDPKLREKAIINHPYLKEKNLNNNDKIIKNNDIVITKDNRLLISAKNKDNQIRTIQSIDAKGNKRFLKGAEKQGNFFLIKGSKENEKTIYITEGVATAMSINHATNCPTIACFDAGNIEKTLKELTTKFKDKNFIIAADNDRFKLNKETNKIEEKSQNIGKQKAINAAKKYNAKVILPNFKNPENKDHIKLLSDFNDLHKHYGIDHVKEQLHNKENYLHLEGVRNYGKNIEIIK